MWKTLANMLLAALAIGLTVFTAGRTLDLLSQWLPAGQQIMQYLGLAAFEGGLYFWAFYFVVGAKGQIQRALAFLMIVVCFLSVAVATVTDLLLVGAADGRLPKIPANTQQAIVVFVGVVIVLNVAAFLGAKLTHPDKLKEMAKQDAEDQIHAMELAMIRSMAPTVAVQMAPIKAQQWVDNTWSQMLPGVARPGVVSVTEEQSAASAPQQQLLAPAKKRGLLGGLFGLGKQEQEPATLEQVTTVSPRPSAPRPFMTSVPTSAEAVRARRHLRRSHRTGSRRAGSGTSQA